MKLALADLKKVVAWIEANTNEINIRIELINSKFIVTCMDKYETLVEITLTNEGALMPKIKKEGILR